MKLFVDSCLSKTAIVSVALLGLTCVAHAAPPTTPTAKPKTGASTNPSTNVVAVPQSVFTLPPTAKDGRDPFFPDSIRIYASAAINTNKTQVSTVTLVLNGMSPGLAMINGTTFGVDETHEIPTSSGRVKVHCTEIKTDSVIVEVNGVPRELRMKEDKFQRDAEGLKGSGK